MAKMHWKEDGEEANRYEEGAEMTSAEAVAAYIAHKTLVDRVSAKTEEDYDGKLREVMRICRDELGFGDWHYAMMRPAALKKLIAWMRTAPRRDKRGELILDSHGKKQRKYSDYSIFRYVVVIKQFYAWLFQERLIGRNLLQGFRNPKAHDEIGVGGGLTASREEFSNLIRSVWEYYESPLGEKGMRGSRGHRERKFHALRNQAMIMFLAATLRRPVEMCRVRRDQLVRLPDGRGQLTLAKNQTKNKQANTVDVDSTTMDYIEAYLALRDTMRFPNGDQGWLFCLEAESEGGNQAINSGRWSITFRRIVKFAQSKGYLAADRRLTPYSLKRYAYKEIYEQEVQVGMQQAGHVSGAAMAAHYVRDQSRSQIQRKMAAQSEARRRMTMDKVALTSGLEYARLK